MIKCVCSIDKFTYSPDGVSRITVNKGDVLELAESLFHSFFKSGFVALQGEKKEVSVTNKPVAVKMVAEAEKSDLVADKLPPLVAGGMCPIEDSPVNTKNKGKK
jgi:hypothetical protein